MGEPIKDRGIQWEEEYRDKSAAQKEYYAKAVGPGSYFRWEGHDGTGQDYYVAITPGFSNKKGYYFFAALRKIPEEHGSSGRKFKTQDEAISYAIETWNIPTPGMSHKHYDVNDIAGHVMSENEATATACSEATVIRTAGDNSMIIIDTTKADTKTERKASLTVSGGHGSNIFPWMGPDDIAAVFQGAYRMKVGGMGLRAALNAFKQWEINDPCNQEKEQTYDRATGQTSTEIVPKVATCISPNQSMLDTRIGTDGIKDRNALFDKNMTIKPPMFPDAPDDDPNYKLTRLGGLLQDGIEASISIGWDKHDAYQKIAAAFTGGMPEVVIDAAGQPVLDTSGKQQMGIRIHGMNEKDGSPAYVKSSDGSFASSRSKFFPERRGTSGDKMGVRVTRDASEAEWGTTKNKKIIFSVPPDLMDAFRTTMGKIATVKPPSLTEQKNALKIFEHLNKTGKLNQASFDDAMRIPIYEDTRSLKGGAVTYNIDTLEPIGIKISKSPKPTGMEGDIDTAAKEKGSTEVKQLQFGPGILDKLYATPIVQQLPGNSKYEKLRLAFLRDLIPLTADMFVDCDSAAYEMRPIRGDAPRTDDNFVPQLDESDPNDLKVQMMRRTINHPTIVSAPTNRVRVYDPEKGTDVIVNRPAEVEAEQRFSGVPTLTDGCRFMLMKQRDPSTGAETEVIRPLRTQEITLHNVKSKNQYMPGGAYTVMVRPAFASAAHRDEIIVHEKHQARGGIYTGYKRVMGKQIYQKGFPKTRHLGPNENGNWPYAQICSIELKDGTWLDFPENGEADSPAVQALARRGDIAGYKYIIQRQWEGKPHAGLGTASKETIEIPRFRTLPDGRVIRDDEPLRLTPEDFTIHTSDSGATPYFKSNERAIAFTAARCRMSHSQIGSWTRLNEQDQAIMDERLVASLKRIENVEAGRLQEGELTEDERTLSLLKGGSTFVPQPVLRAFAAAGKNATDFEATNGPLFGIYDAREERFVHENNAIPTVFGTEARAREYLAHLADTGTNVSGMEVRPINRKPDGSFGPSLPSTWQASQEAERTGTPQPSLVEGRDVETAVSMLSDQEMALPEQDKVPEPEAEPLSPPVEPSAPVEPPALETPGVPTAPSAVGIPEALPEAAKPGAPNVPEPEPELVGAPGIHDKEAAALARLVKLADRLDDAGKLAEADAVDKLIYITAKKMAT